MAVFVLDKRQKPLMPFSEKRARLSGDQVKCYLPSGPKGPGFRALNKMKMSRFLLILILLASCQKKEPSHFFGHQMTMSWQVKIADEIPASKKQEIETTIAKTFFFIDHTFNNWNPYSEISKINQLGADQKIILSEPLANFLTEVGKLVKLTEGRFDPTVEPLQKIYKHCLAKNHLPKDKNLKELESAVGWDKIHLEGNVFWKDHPKTAIDLSGVAKGYAVDLLVERLEELGYHNLFVEWGGEVKILGQPKERKWNIGLENNEVIALESGSIATSGSRYQKWVVEGVVYTHIIDPQKKRPLLLLPGSISSVSVQGDQCFICDALATSLMLFASKKEAQNWADDKKISCFISDYPR